MFMLIFALIITCVGCNYSNNANDSSAGNNTPACQHTTQIGTCQKCDIFQNQTDYNTIKSQTSEASKLVEVALRSISSISNTGNDYTQRLSNAIQSTQTQIEDARDCLNDAISLCDHYSELSKVLEGLTRARNALPTKLNTSNTDDIQHYLDGLRTFSTEIAATQVQLIYIK